MEENTVTGESLDLVSQNIEKMRELFPGVFTEGKINFEKLKLVLGKNIDNFDERYNFTWKGKYDSIKESQKPSNGTLIPCKNKSKNWNITQNLCIEGDNLEVLKLLQKSYYNKIKMIYIDPPYNTGKDFIYLDNYKDNLQNYIEKDNQGFKISSNFETDGRYHTKWLNMMYPRLKLARNLISDEGMIFISIDNHEFSNLKKICDEIFGESNFITSLVWTNKEGGGSSDSNTFRIKHEFILIYAKNINNITILGTEISNIERYKQTDNFKNIRGPYYLQKLGMGSIQYSNSLDYPIEAPDGTIIYPKDNNNGKKACWRWSENKFNWGLQNGFIEIKKDSKDQWTVYSKQYLKCDNDGNLIKRTQRPMGVIDKFSSTQAAKYLKNLNMDNMFNYSKPYELIEYLMERTFSENENNIIMDFFAGSCTTGDATLNFNVKHNSKINYILIQLPEILDINSDAYKSGFKNICEIGEERIRRAGDKIVEESGNKDLDIGFKVFKLDSSNLIKWNPNYDNLEDSLVSDANNIVPDRTDFDLVYEVMLKYGIDLTVPVEEKEINDKKVYSVGFGALLICLDNNISSDFAEDIIKVKDDLDSEVTRVVFKDNGFVSDSDKTNIKETLRANNIEEFITI